jgi:hypothetical protein
MFVGQTASTGFAGVRYNGFIPSENAASAGVLGGSLAISADGTFAADTAGDYVLTPSGVTAANYNVAFENGTFTVVPADTLLLRVASAETSYGTAASYSITSAEYFAAGSVNTATISNLTNNQVTVSSGEVFTLIPVGAGKSTSDNYVVGAYQIGSSDFVASNNFTGLTIVGDHTIVPLEINITDITAANKDYDGTTVASIVTTGASGWLAGDEVTVEASGQFADKNAATAKVVDLYDTSYAGADVANYNIIDQATATADIAPLAITITGITASNKIYDGGVVAKVDTRAAKGWLSGDDFTVTATGAFANKTVDTGKAVTLTSIYSGADYDAGNYTITDHADVTADITAKTLTVSGITANNRVYNGDTDATVNVSEILYDGLIEGDSITVDTAAGQFEDKNVGAAKLVTLTNEYGGDAANYFISGQTTTTANITTKTLTATATATGKTYNGTTDADVKFVLSGLADGESLGETSVVASFNSANVGSRTATISSFSLVDGDSNLASNYTLVREDVTESTMTADITAKTLSATAAVLDRAYDGTTDADVSFVLSGLVDGESLGDTTVLASFDGANVGEYTATINSFSLEDGESNLASNYSLVGGDVSFTNNTANIRAKSLSATASVSAKTYDGNTDADVKFVLSGLVDGESLGETSVVASFNSANAGPRTATISSFSLEDGDSNVASNYSLLRDDVSFNNTANIRPKSLSATAAVSSKTYDGNTDADVSFTLSGLVDGESLGDTKVVANFNSAEVGTRSASIKDHTLKDGDTALASNYVLRSEDISFSNNTAEIQSAAAAAEQAAEQAAAAAAEAAQAASQAAAAAAAAEQAQAEATAAATAAAEAAAARESATQAATEAAATATAADQATAAATAASAQAAAKAEAQQQAETAEAQATAAATEAATAAAEAAATQAEATAAANSAAQTATQAAAKAKAAAQAAENPQQDVQAAVVQSAAQAAAEAATQAAEPAAPTPTNSRDTNRGGASQGRDTERGQRRGLTSERDTEKVERSASNTARDSESFNRNSADTGRDSDNVDRSASNTVGDRNSSEADSSENSLNTNSNSDRETSASSDSDAISDGANGDTSSAAGDVINAPSFLTPVALKPVSITSGSSFTVEIPKATFTHENPSESLTFSATQADGSPLPSWVKFDAETQTFTGEAPEGVQQSLDLVIIASDSASQQMSVELRIEIN